MLIPVWNEKCIRLQIKLRIFNTNVKSALLYGSETWRSTKLPIKKIEDTYQEVLREDLEYPLPKGHFKWRNIGNDTSESHTRKHQERKTVMNRVYATEAWCNIINSALECNPQGFRRRGRQRQYRRRSVQDGLAKKNITWLETKRTFKNRVRWRSMVHALCSPLRAKMA